MKKQGNKKNTGITLIALVITIIVLLILAGVTIATLTGENGILKRANDAKEQTEVASVKEQAQLDIANWVAEELKNGRDATISDWEDIKSILDTANSDVQNRYYKDVTIDGIITPNDYVVPIEELYINNPDGDDVPEFDENTLIIGEAINTENYGLIVPEYTVQTSEMNTSVWRLFYQDTNCTYLITDEVVGSYRPSDYYSSDTNGSMVSTVGQRLNSKLLDAGTFFIESNTNSNIKATEWLTDTSETSMWNEYKNEDVAFAIGSPTAELYVASYNATATANGASSILLEVGTYGYIDDTKSNQLKTSYNFGIYNKSTSSNYWLASPSNSGDNREFMVLGALSTFMNNQVDGNKSCAVRPIVCMKTSVFNLKYTLSNPVDKD